MLVLAIVALEVPLARSVADRVDAEVRSQARSQADVVAASLSELLGPGDRDERARIVSVAAEDVRGRVIVVDGRGDLLADSEGAPVGRSYGGRPEIAAALAGRADQRERHSRTLGQDLLATAVPVIDNGRPVGAVRITQSVEAVDRAVRRAWLGLVLVGLVVLGLGLAVGWVMAGQIAGPVRRLDRAARRVGEGNLEARAPVEGSAEQRSLARTFNEMTERLQVLLASQREFVADASHQLRTPLTGLRLRIEEARAAAADQSVREDLDAALAELDRLSHMIDELLELSRAGESQAHGELLSLAAIAERAAARWARDGRVTAGREADTRVWAGRADVERILDALLENAVNYAPGDVELVAVPGGIEVRDRGPGIAEAEREAVFERFHRGSAGRRGAAGTGLGLPIARQLARRWGGDVTLRPRAGGGTVAALHLPRADFADPSPGDA